MDVCASAFLSFTLGEAAGLCRYNSVGRMRFECMNKGIPGNGG